MMTRFGAICRWPVVWGLFVTSVATAVRAESQAPPTIVHQETPVFQQKASPAETEDTDLTVHLLRSEYQSDETRISVLLPNGGDDTRPYRSLYVLPVEARDGQRWGSPLEEVKKHDLHNLHRLACVFPTFSDLPWYADHSSDPAIRQESYLLEVVIPWVEENFPVMAERDGRLLVGFSKSGWGAYSLLLRHPDVFGRAAAWDAPLAEDRPLRYGMGPIFGGQENFERYRILGLLEKRADSLQGSPRLVLTGYDNFRTHHLTAHGRMDELGISHVWRDGPKRKHHWNSGWLAEAVELLAGR
jgi:hypothetical protein